MNHIKFFIILFSTFTFTFSSAENHLSEIPSFVVCHTIPSTTTFEFREQGDEMVLRVFHHNGPLYAPVHTGTVTEADLNRLKDRARLYERLGNPIEYSFKKESCTLKGHTLNCFENVKTRIGNVELANPRFSINRYELSDVDRSSVYMYDQAGFGFLKQRNSTSWEMMAVEMRYHAPYPCRMTK